eukprot:COSAG06_NODE_7899_length_2338_cov_1.818222_2_plen_287_part_00
MCQSRGRGEKVDELAPYLYRVPKSLSEYGALLSVFQDKIKKQFDAVNYLNCLEEMSRKSESLSEQSIKDTIEVLRLLVAKGKALRARVDVEGAKEEMEDLEARMKEVKIPTDKNQLALARKSYYIDNQKMADRMDTSDMDIAHDLITVAVAEAVGIRPLSSSMDHDHAADETADGGVGGMFGQTIDLCAALKNILEQYPVGSGILKEMLQNADDARASKFHVVYDKRTHKHDKDLLFATGDYKEELSQGPSFLVWDDIAMSAESIKAIQTIAQSSKVDDYGKTVFV